MIDYIITSVIALLGLIAIVITMIVSAYRVHKIDAKVSLVETLIANGYETDKLDVNDYLK